MFRTAIPHTRPRCRSVTAGASVRRRRSACAGAYLLAFLLTHAGTNRSCVRALSQTAPTESTVSVDVYVNDSFESRDALARAQVLARNRRWTEAAEVLHEASARYAAMVASTGRPGAYTSVGRLVRQTLASWPPEGVSAWRQLYEAESTAELSALGTERPDAAASWLAAYERFFISTEAGKATDELAQRLIERGLLESARSVYEDALRFHPDRDRYEAIWRRHLALVLAMTGDAAEARRLLEIDDPGLMTGLRWMGEDRRARDVLTEIERAFTDLHACAPHPTDWPQWGGSPSRTRVGECNVSDPGLLWRHHEDEGFSAAAWSPPDAPEEAQRRSPLERSAGLRSIPVASDELVVRQRTGELIAFQRRSGAKVWTWPDRDMTAGAALSEAPTGALELPAIHAGAVIAAVATPSDTPFVAEAQPGPGALACLDHAGGRLRWLRTLASFGREHSDVTFDAAPLILRDQVFILGRRRRAFGFEDAYLYRLAARDGRLLSRVHVGSASTGSFGYRRATYSILAADRGLVFVCPQLGTIAAISEITGDVVWLRAYGQSAQRTRAGRPSSEDVAAWTFSPPFCLGDRIVVLPSDADELLVLNAADGSTLAQVPRAQLSDAECLVGVVDSLVVTTGAAVCAYDLGAQELRWSTSLGDGQNPLGRPALLSDRVLVPTGMHLSTFDLRTGARTDRPWDADGGGGNLLPLGDVLLVAGDRSLSAYMRREDIWEELRNRMQRNPEDPAAALDFAEVALRDRAWSDAEALLIEADRRAAAAPPADDALRRRLYAATMTVASRFASAGLVTPDRLEAWHRIASVWTYDPASGVQYRLKFAELYETQGDAARAINLYQQVLADRSLREVALAHSGPLPPRAGRVAMTAINRILTARGREVYAPFEEQARRTLQTARAASDLAAIDAVIDTYPNARAAAEATLLSGDLLLSAGKHEDAARRYIDAYYRYPDLSDPVDTIRRIAVALDRAGKRTQVYGWLTRGVREFPSATVPVDAERLTFAQYRERFADARRHVEPARPELVLPLRPAHVLDLADDPTLLHPRFTGDGDRERAFFVAASGAVQAYDPASGRAIWSSPRPVVGAPQVILVAASQVILAGSHRVEAVNAADGRLLWAFGEVPPDLGNPDRDWEGLAPFVHFAVRERELLCIRDDGEAACLSIDDGRPQWSSRLAPPPVGDLPVCDDRLTYTAAVRDQLRLHALRWAPDESMRSVPLDPFGPVSRRVATFDGQLLLVCADRIVACDPVLGVPRWTTSVSGRVREAALAVDVDGLYVTTDGRSISRYNLSDGREAWRTPPLMPRGDEGMSITVQDGNVIVADARSVHALDGFSGRVLWKGVTPEERPNFFYRAVTSAYVAAIDVRPQDSAVPSRAFFYDHRNASGVLPREGGVLTLEGVREFTDARIIDHALVVQSGNRFHIWADGERPPAAPPAP
ncbi:MAG: Outer membrane protein assembly factor BamB [Phycisphaerae bacterium]|nr:Outer membrane protein assembly factor BamB [Phycisphaerae bacterium]